MILRHKKDDVNQDNKLKDMDFILINWKHARMPHIIVNWLSRAMFSYCALVRNVLFV